MALKDIFTMIKADRYTADGCAEIEKAQKAIAEDAGLPNGSQTTRKDGVYRKENNKWVKVSNGKAPAKKDAPAESKPTQTKAERQTEAARQKFDRIKEGDEVTAYGTKVKIVKKRQNGTVDVEFESDNGEKVVSNLSMGDIEENAPTENKTDAEVGLHEGEEDLPDFVKGYSLLSEEHDQDTRAANAKLYPSLQPLVKQREPFMKKRIEAFTKLRDNPNNPKARADFVDASNAIAQIDADIDRAYKKATAEDAAPRVLTGDCKIRVRKS